MRAVTRRKQSISECSQPQPESAVIIFRGPCIINTGRRGVFRHARRLLLDRSAERTPVQVQPFLACHRLKDRTPINPHRLPLSPARLPRSTSPSQPSSPPNALSPSTTPSILIIPLLLLQPHLTITALPDPALHLFFRTQSRECSVDQTCSPLNFRSDDDTNQTQTPRISHTPKQGTNPHFLLC